VASNIGQGLPVVADEVHVAQVRVELFRGRQRAGPRTSYILDVAWLLVEVLNTHKAMKLRGNDRKLGVCGPAGERGGGEGGEGGSGGGGGGGGGNGLGGGGKGVGGGLGGGGGDGLYGAPISRVR
jgi:hypothetical protein